MRDEYFLIRGELHECHPDGIRAIACATFGSYAISKDNTPQGLTCATFGSCYSCNSCSLK